MTGDNILLMTKTELAKVGLEDMYVEVFRKVSDAGSNMKKGWKGFAGGNQTCVDHKIERDGDCVLAQCLHVNIINC